ncbi:MAG: hypothetical protein NUV73_00645, partial [Candidatus Daviesbacteria bacterium]|nr:hypothetical protein [Candidatus Daviesbacteria bacterium]
HHPPLHPGYLPPPIKVTENKKYSETNDPPLVSLSFTNPVTYLKLFIKKILNNEGITIKIKPLTAIAMIAALSLAFGSGFNVAQTFFPNSSPILKRPITLQGTVQKSETGQFYLSLPDNTFWTLSGASQNLFPGKQAIVKGNLTPEPNVIKVSEIIAFESGQNSPAPVAESLSPASLPGLYPNLQWESDEKKTLTFTSGKRRVDLEGIRLESKEVKEYPTEFINYYESSLLSLGFKQTLNRKDEEGMVESFENTGKYFTFGVKHIFQGSGDNKTVVGYKAYIEHN